MRRSIIVEYAATTSKATTTTATTKTKESILKSQRKIRNNSNGFLANT